MNAKAFAYDANGNTQTMVTSSGTTTYSWDFENRLASVTLPGSGGTVQFSYDPFGRRIKKSSNASTSIFAYDGDDIVEETNAAGTAVARYARTEFVDEPLAILRSGTTSYYEADALGSITSLSNSAGSLAQSYTFDSFGNTTNSSGSLTNTFQFTGRELDSETMLYFMRARYFSPATGRFLSEDPTRFLAGENFYSYVENDATNYVDSFGLCSNDVKRIVNAARNAVNNMTMNGERIYGGNLNNYLSTFRKLNPFSKLPPYKGCGEQTDNVVNQITPLIPSMECNWQPTMHFEFLTLQHRLPHQWVSYSSNDPTDPTIELDPWNNQYQLVPPGGKLNESGWKPLVPGVNNPLVNSIKSCCKN